MSSGSGRPTPGGGEKEQCQTFILERQTARHRSSSRNHNHATTATTAASTKNEQTPLLVPRPAYMGGTNSNNNQNNRTGMTISSSAGSLSGQMTTLSEDRALSTPHDSRNIRFQVVIWNIGKLDVVSGSVPMTFRISLFWNDDTIAGTVDDPTLDDDDTLNSSNVHHVWKMHGRQKAFQQELSRDVLLTKAVPVPSLAILNVATFETVGAADIEMLDENSRLMRWTCMYRATVIQDNLRVDQFPHDDHDIQLKLAVLSNRGKGASFDRRYWSLGLATSDDSAGSTRVPHGLVVDQARIPGFAWNKRRGLQFEFCSLDHGTEGGDDSGGGNATDHSNGEMCLTVHLNVLRESGYYDLNIVPLLALLNVVAVSVLTFEDTEFFYRGLITLNIAFVEMSIRMTADSHLPSVGYEIRLQRILNEFFVVLMLLVLEAMSVYVLRTYYGVAQEVTKWMDWLMAIFAISHNVMILMRYYKSKRQARERLDHGWQADKKSL